MTKLNITNKTIYKLKKNKNQSKKNVPKKKKYKKRKHKNGRSFRKRRRKYNIKNNSIKKYKKQKGGAGDEIDTKTASIKNKEKEVKQLEEKHKKEENRLIEESEKLQELKKRKDEGEDTNALGEELLQLGVISEDEKRKLNKMTEYKEYFKDKFKQEKKDLGDLKKKINKIQNEIKGAIKRIRSKIDEKTKKTAEKKSSENIIEKLQEQKTTVPGQNSKSLDGRIKQQQDKIVNLKRQIQEAAAEEKAQTLMIITAKQKFYEHITEYFNNLEFNSRPKSEELVKGQDGKYTPRKTGDDELPKEHDDNLQNKISKKSPDTIKEIKDEETIDRMTEQEKKDYGKTKEDKFNEYYDKNKDIDKDFNEIAVLLANEQKWINDTIKKIEKRKKTADENVQAKNLELTDKAKENEEEIKSETTKLFNERQKNAKTEMDIKKKKEEIQEEEAKWKQTQDEASKTIEKGEEVFQKKIEEISNEDAYKNREIDVVKKQIEGAKKALNDHKKEYPGPLASKSDKEKYYENKRNMEKDLDKLNQEYDKITEGVKDKFSKPSMISRQATKDKYKQDIEEEARKEKKKSEARKLWAKAGLVASKVLHTKFILPLLGPQINDYILKKYLNKVKKKPDDVLTEEEYEKIMEETDNYKFIYNTPYISNDQDDVYAHAEKPNKPNFGKPFYNFYLKKTIKTPNNEMQIFKMIEQRKARYIKWLMRKENVLKEKKELIEEIKKFEPDETSLGLIRNTLDEKIKALTFLEFLISRTDKVWIPPLPENSTQEQQEELEASKLERSIIDLHKTTIDGDSLFKLFCIYVPGYVKDMRKKVSQDVINSVSTAGMTQNTAIGENDIFNSGFNKWSSNKNIYNECGEFVKGEYDDNYVNIGLSKLSNVDGVWNENEGKKEEESKMQESVEKYIKANNDNQVVENERKEKLKEIVNAIKKIIEELKIQESVNRNMKLDEENQNKINEIESLKLKLDNKKLDKLNKQKQKYEEKEKKAKQKLAVQEGLLKAQKENIQKQEQDMENIKANLEAQRKGLEKCTEEEAGMREQYNAKITELQQKLNDMEQDKKDMREKMEELEEKKKQAEDERSEYQQRIEKAETESETIKKDIEDIKSPTKVTEESAIGDAESDEGDPLEDALDATTTEDGAIDIPLKENEPMMFYLTLGTDGNINVATSKTPGENISSWLMGSNTEESADK